MTMPLLSSTLDRLAHGAAADVETLAKVRLGRQGGSGREFIAQNALGEGFDDVPMHARLEHGFDGSGQGHVVGVLRVRRYRLSRRSSARHASLVIEHERPPSMAIEVALIKGASSLARKTAVIATSSACQCVWAGEGHRFAAVQRRDRERLQYSTARSVSI